MNIDDLTVGQLRKLAPLIARLGLTAQPEPVQQQPHPFVGEFVICRCYSAGVHVGELISFDGDRAILHNSRRLWYWQATEGLALSGVAQNGITRESKVDTLNPRIALTGVIEVIPCTEAARDSILNF